MRLEPPTHKGNSSGLVKKYEIGNFSGKIQVDVGGGRGEFH